MRKSTIKSTGLRLLMIGVSIGLLMIPCQAEGELPESEQIIKWCTWVEPLAKALDPNWNPADCFVPAWESVQLTSTMNNPDEKSDVDNLESTQNLNVSINMHKAVCDGLISDLTFIHPLTVTAMDDQDNTLESDTSSSGSRHYRLQTTSLPPLLADRPARLSITFPMDPNQGYPLTLKELEFSFCMLTAESFKYIEVPFQVFEQPIEILPGYFLTIEEATSEGENYSFRMQFEVTEGAIKPSSSVFVREDRSLPVYMDAGVTLLNAEGNDVHKSESGSRGTSGHGSGNISTVTGDGRCAGCGGIKTIQFKFAVNPSEVELAYVLRDIPIPTF